MLFRSKHSKSRRRHNSPTMATVCRLHNDFRTGGGTTHTGGSGYEKGWTYGPGCNVKLYCKGCNQFCIQCLGTGTVDFGDWNPECTRGCGTSYALSLHGVLLGGLSGSTTSRMNSLCVEITGKQYVGSEDDERVVDIAINDSHRLCHNEYYVFTETARQFRYRKLIVRTY